MFLGIWLAMFAFAVGATATWALLEKRIPMATASSMGAWGWLSFSSEQIEVASSGIVLVREAPWIQMFSLFMAVISALGLLLWWFGDFPPTEQEQSLEQMEDVTN